jgi:hypothetical protein
VWKPFSIESQRAANKPEENPSRKNEEKEEKNKSLGERGRRSKPEEDRIFKPPSSPHFQAAAGSLRDLRDLRGELIFTRRRKARKNGGSSSRETSMRKSGIRKAESGNLAVFAPWRENKKLTQRRQRMRRAQSFLKLTARDREGNSGES